MLKNDKVTRDALADAFYRDTRGAGGNDAGWERLIAKANELATANALAGDTIRVVRCPEVEVVGEIADPVKMHGQGARIVYLDNGGDLHIARAHELTPLSALVRWCLEFDLARDPATATWHERTAQRVRRWTPETVPEPGRRVVRYFANGDYVRLYASPSLTAQQRADEWNRLGDVTHWHDAPDAERAE